MKAIRESGVIWLNAVPAFLLLFLCLIAPFGQRVNGAEGSPYTFSSGEELVHFAKALDLSPSPFLLEPAASPESLREISQSSFFTSKLFCFSLPGQPEFKALIYFYRPDQRQSAFRLLYPHHNFW